MKANCVIRTTVIGAAHFCGALANAGGIWDTGGAHQVNFNGADSYLGFSSGNNTGFSNCAWLTGGDLQAEDLEQDFMWRSSTFPSPGFDVYAPGNILPGANMAGGQDRWNPSFVLYGDVVPAPGAMALLGLGGLTASRRRR